MLSIEVRWYGVWDFFKIIHSRGERTSTIREIRWNKIDSGLTAEAGWWVCWGSSYWSLYYLRHFYGKKQEKILPIKGTQGTDGFTGYSDIDG